LRSLTLALVQPLMADMSDCAMSGYPDEACGLVVERDGRLNAVCCKNLQNELHQRFPDRYTRDARTAYNLDPRAIYEAQESGGVVRAVFHSHPERGAYFSDEDILSALGGDPNGEPILPGVDYLVLSARADGIDDAKLFSWDVQTRLFEESKE